MTPKPTFCLPMLVLSTFKMYKIIMTSNNNLPLSPEQVRRAHSLPKTILGGQNLRLCMNQVMTTQTLRMRGVISCHKQI